MNRKHVKTSGPMFDGRAKRAVEDFCRNFAKSYADDATGELHDRFGRVFKNPTGRFEAGVRARRVGPNTSIVTSRSPYAAWLEGTSPRNRSSSFKGYGSFRLVAERMERQAETVANSEFRRNYLRRMN